MRHRLTKITTRTGDDGTTGLGDGTRVPKDHVRVTAYGTVDELNAALGAVLAESIPDRVAPLLREIQHDLFDLGAELCIPGNETLVDEQLERLDRAVEELNVSLPALREFILPAGTRAAAACHVARTVCRRAERALVTLARAEPVRGLAIRYLNRLSDLLFVVSRVLNQAAGMGEAYWKQNRHE